MILVPLLCILLLQDPNPPNRSASDEGHNEELAGLFAADQADRRAALDAPNDEERRRAFHRMNENDPRRLERLRVLMEADALKTPQDYFYATVLTQHGDGVESVALAHELALIPLFHHHAEATRLAAKAYDRLLVRLGHAQRFGTQYGPGPKGNRIEDAVLRPVRPGVSDSMRRCLLLRSLEIARENADYSMSDLPDVSALDAFAERPHESLEVWYEEATQANVEPDQEDLLDIVVEVRALIDADGLRCADDFYRAAVLMTLDEALDSRLLAHELALAAASLGAPKAKTLIPRTWDRLLLALGLSARMGTDGSSPRVVAGVARFFGVGSGRDGD